ncbi:helix-turn-helix domain-containing protein [Deinococcus oregonensis]|uniref:Helix-turn-helix domain-containing protein n=1 Tax=Deinococcus oregonensis TaxID=1805970 RepID=A0ABV6AVP9_9DEIO
MKVEEFWAAVRETMRTQPRGYQTQLAEQLGVEKSYISRFIQGKHDLAPKYHQAVLDSIGLELDLKTKGKA